MVLILNSYSPELPIPLFFLAHLLSRAAQAAITKYNRLDILINEIFLRVLESGKVPGQVLADLVLGESLPPGR